MQAIDLFSGCGGLTVGLKRAGFDVIAAVEFESLAASVYELNHPDTLLVQKDIKKIKTKKLKKKLKLKKGELDLLAGCPPCQGFSSMRTKNGSKRVREPMNDLIFEFLNFVEVFHPKTIMLENVPGLSKNWRIREFEKKLKDLGYLTCRDVLNAADYGVPQNRRRMVLLASRIGEPELAQKSAKKKTVRDAIGNLEKPGLGNDALHDYTSKRSDKIEKMIKLIPKNGGSRSNLPNRMKLKCHKKTDGFKDVYGRMWWEKPSPTMTGGCINPSRGRYLHPNQDRPITLREASLLQGFPKKYKFVDTKGKYPIAQLIGNAFPPEFACRHARKLVALIKSKAA